LRFEDGSTVKRSDIEYVAAWDTKAAAREINFRPARVLLQDFTGVPCIVDLAAMRDALAALGADPKKANPLIPVDLVIDHSVQVDQYGTAGAFQANALLEFQRNQERYAFLKWGQSAFQNFRAVPPDTGIVHQVNLEYLAPVVFAKDGEAYPDTVVGTDSHTTMINGLGVLGFNVETAHAMKNRVDAYKAVIKEATPVGQYVNDNVMISSSMLCLEDGKRARQVLADSGMSYFFSLLFLYHDTFPIPDGAVRWPDRLPERIEAPLAIGPELDPDGLSELRATLADHPGVEVVPLWLRGRATGVGSELSLASGGHYELRFFDPSGRGAPLVFADTLLRTGLRLGALELDLRTVSGAGVLVSAVKD
jgi:hypothetical protein